MYFPRCNVDKWNICGLLFIFLDKLPVGANIAKIIEVPPFVSAVCFHDLDVSVI